jgi:6-phosphogluconate dehydrogenase
MQIGLVGLGRMGANMSRRWLRDGHTVAGYARHAETVNGLVAADFADRVLSAMRYGFGGHEELKG